MKKYLILSLALGVLFAAPVAAEENNVLTSDTTSVVSTTALKTKEKKPVVKKYIRRPVTLKGELVSVSASQLPATLTMKVSSVSPKKNEKWTGAYPEISKEITLNLDANTKFFRKSWGKSSLTELTQGDQLWVLARTNEDGSVSATNVKDESLHYTLRVHTGTVQTIDVTLGTLSVKQLNGTTVNVKTSTSTKIFVAGISATLNEVKVGDKVHLRGILNSKTKALDAQLIRVGAAKESTPTSTVL